MKRVNPIQPNFGIRIKNLRFVADMSQQELAELCELSVDQIANFERGKNFASETSIAMLASAFGCPPAALFDYSGNDAFVKTGGLKWRATRKASNLRARNGTVRVMLSRGRV